MQTAPFTKHVLPPALILLLTGILYYPALDSIFILDDSANLRDLAFIHDRGWLYYLLGGSSGPSGRPLSLLTFALQAASWPDSPFAFKCVNLLIHLLNGGLVYTLTLLLGGLLFPDQKHRQLLALLVSLIWLLHPIHVNTVLYTVQRMTLLSALFSLIAIYSVLKFCLPAGVERHSVKLPVLVLCLYGPMLPAILSKETGFLIPLYILSVMMTVGIRGCQKIENRTTVLTILLFPVVVCLIYLVFFKNLQAIYSIRPYTMGERLLTECNVLVDYLLQIIIPASHEFSLFHDDYTVATGLLTPPRTLFSFLLIAGLVISAISLRRKYPVYSLALLWFFSGHLLESTVIGLELYYEHRNYVPMYGIVLCLAWCLIAVSRRVQQRYVVAIITVWCIATMLTTASGLELWKNPYLQAREWSTNHPQSRRALGHYWNMSLVYGAEGKPGSVYHEFRRQFPQEVYPVIKQVVNAACYGDESITIDESFWEEARQLAQSTRRADLSVVSGYEDLMYRFSIGMCDTGYLQQLIYLNDDLLKNPNVRHLRKRLLDINTTLSYHISDYDRAVYYIEQNSNHATDPGLLVSRAEITLAAGNKAGARRLVTRIRDILDKQIKSKLYYDKRLDQIEQRSGP